MFKVFLLTHILAKRRWSQATIIELYNSEKGPRRPEYPTKSLDNKNLDKVLGDIVELLMAPLVLDGTDKQKIK